MLDHLIGDHLRQKESALGVDAHDIVIAFLCHFQDVGSHLGSNTGNIDQRTDLPLSGCRVKKPLAGFRRGYITRYISKIQALNIPKVRILSPAHAHDGVALSRQSQSRGFADSAGNTSYNCNAHSFSSLGFIGWIYRGFGNIR